MFVFAVAIVVLIVVYALVMCSVSESDRPAHNKHNDHNNDYALSLVMCQRTLTDLFTDFEFENTEEGEQAFFFDVANCQSLEQYLVINGFYSTYRQLW